MGKGKKSKFELREKSSISRDFKGIETRNGRKDPFIVLSLRELDRNQGQGYQEWEKEGILALAVSKLQEVCSLTRLEATSKQIIKEYPKGVFPPKSDFTHPKHVPNDIAWCSMHIQGKECVIGYFDENIFNIVFLDKDHRFWISEKKNT